MLLTMSVVRIVLSRVSTDNSERCSTIKQALNFPVLGISAPACRPVAARCQNRLLRKHWHASRARLPPQIRTSRLRVYVRALRSAIYRSINSLVCEGVARSLVQAGHGVMTAKGFFRAGVGLPRASASFPWL